MVYKHFYSELGKLLYAVADVDGVITPEEKRALEEIITEELAPTEEHKDEYGTDVAFYTEIEFDFLDEQIAEPEAAFNSFIDFVEDHRTAFTPAMKKVCVRLAAKLAEAYRGTSGRERQLIDRLNESLAKIEFGRHRKERKKKASPGLIYKK